MGTLKVRLLELFGHWNDNVVDLIKATPEEDVLRRDIYDRCVRCTLTVGHHFRTWPHALVRSLS